MYAVAGLTRKKVSCGDILWNTTLWIEDLPDLEAKGDGMVRGGLVGLESFQTFPHLVDRSSISTCVLLRTCAAPPVSAATRTLSAFGRTRVCVPSQLNVLSAGRHPAQPVSVPILHAREIQALWSQKTRHRDTTVRCDTSTGELAMQRHAIVLGATGTTHTPAVQIHRETGKNERRKQRNRTKEKETHR